jgi:hypothetical protein
MNDMLNLEMQGPAHSYDTFVVDATGKILAFVKQGRGLFESNDWGTMFLEPKYEGVRDSFGPAVRVTSCAQISVVNFVRFMREYVEATEETIAEILTAADVEIDLNTIPGPKAADGVERIRKALHESGIFTEAQCAAAEIYRGNDIGTYVPTRFDDGPRWYVTFPQEKLHIWLGFSVEQAVEKISVWWVNHKNHRPESIPYSSDIVRPS